MAKKSIFILIMLFSFLLNNYESNSSTNKYSLPLNLKVSNNNTLQDENNIELYNMIKAFLTDNNFYISEKKNIPVISVDGMCKKDKKVQYKVTCTIKSFELTVDDSSIYFLRDISSYYYGDEKAALSGALDLLKLDLNKEILPILNEKLNAIHALEGYNIDKDNLDKVIKDILDQFNKIYGKLDHVDKISNNINSMIKKKIKSGDIKLTIKDIYKIKNIISKKKCEYNNYECNKPLSNNEYKAVNAILIRVPVKNLEEFKSGIYSILIQNCYCLFRDKPQQYISFKMLKNKEPDLFGLNKHYLDIKAQEYIPSEHSIIITNCDALNIVNSNNRGLDKGSIFNENKIFIIPEVKIK